MMVGIGLLLSRAVRYTIYFFSQEIHNTHNANVNSSALKYTHIIEVEQLNVSKVVEKQCRCLKKYNLSNKRRFTLVYLTST